MQGVSIGDCFSSEGDGFVNMHANLKNTICHNLKENAYNGKNMHPFQSKVLLPTEVNMFYSCSRYVPFMVSCQVTCSILGTFLLGY